MTTYFGLCDSAGNPTGSTAGNTGSAETDWNNAQVYTCPGSGPQTIVEISADLKNVTNYNIRLAVYNSAGTTLIAQGTAAVAVTGASDSWQGHLTQASITPNPATLTGGTNYLIVLSGSGDIQSTHTTSGTNFGSFASVDETGGYPASLPAGTATTLIFPVRVGVNPPDSTYSVPVVSRGGRGVDLGPAGRRMMPQRFPDTIPLDQGGSSSAGPFRRGMGPRMRFRLAQRLSDNSLNAYSLPATTGAYVLTGVAAPLQHNDDLVATTGTYVVTGNAATLEHGYLISPAKGAYVLTGMAVTFSRAYVLSATTGVYSLTGRVLNLIVGRLVSAASGAYVLAGISDSFLRGYTVAPSSGPYTLVGNTATLTYSGATASPSPTQNAFIASAPKMMNRR